MALAAQTWEINFPPDTTLNIRPVTSIHIRSDFSQPSQLYFSSKVKLGSDKVKLVLFQAHADNGSSASLVPFFHKNVTKAINEDVVDAIIDEVKGKLYLWTSTNYKNSELVMNRSYIFMMDIDFGQPDQMGFRHVTVDKESRELFFNKKWNNPILYSLSKPFICPSGDLYVIIGEGEDFKKRLIGKIQYDSSTGKTMCNMVNVLKVDSVKPTDKCKSCTLSVSRNQVVIEDIISYFDEHEERRSLNEYSTVLLSSEPKLINIHCLFIDTIKYPPEYFQTSLTSAFCSRDFKLIGRIHKYYIFMMNSPSVLAVATRDLGKRGLGGDWRISTKKIHEDFTWNQSFKTFFSAISQEIIKWTDQSTIYVQGGMKVMPLYQNVNLKDYRYCAHCKKQEGKKRRNHDNKRIADFRTCRECKRRNFHLLWRDYDCFYCSMECMRANWLIHKQVHEKPPFNRNFDPWMWM